MFIDLSAALATIFAALGGFGTALISRDTSIHTAFRLTVVIAISIVVYIGTEIVADVFTVTFEEKIEGQWIEVFHYNPNPKQSYSIATIGYNKKIKKLELDGYGYDQDGKKLASWNSDLVVPYSQDNRVIYNYSGSIYGDKITNTDGLGIIKFRKSFIDGKDQFNSGNGEYREDVSKYEKVDYTVRRITSESIKELIGKDVLKEEDYSKYIRAYHAAHSKNP